MSKDTVEVQWVWADMILKTDDKYDIISEGKKRILVIKDSILADAGKYAAMVGESKATARLKVIGKIDFIQVYMQILFYHFII